MNTFHAYYNFHFGSLDCVAFGTACSDHNVVAFPQFILYHDGEEVKTFDGVKDMKGLSDFIEGILESIKPGSRTVGGPKLPAPGATSSNDYQAPEAAPNPDKKPAIVAPPQKAAEDVTPAPQKDIKEPETRASAPLVATPVKPKPKKPTKTPNPIGTSISLTAETFQRQVVRAVGDAC